MEYLIGLLIIVMIYLRVDMWRKSSDKKELENSPFKDINNAELDGGDYGKKKRTRRKPKLPKVVKKKTKKRTRKSK